MSDTTMNRRFKRWGSAVVAASAVGALALPLTMTPVHQANAQAWVQVGPLGFGVGGPYYSYYNYPYYTPYYAPHYTPYYYGYYPY